MTYIIKIRSVIGRVKRRDERRDGETNGGEVHVLEERVGLDLVIPCHEIRNEIPNDLMMIFKS